MSFRTFHFDGVVRVPGYLAWLMQCDMRETYTFHRQVLKLLQWHCPPTLWHLKTPVHMFSLDALVEAYPNAKFLWSHRDPAKVLALGVQPDPVRAQLEQRPRRRTGTRCRTAGMLGGGCPARDGLPKAPRRQPIRRRVLRRPAMPTRSHPRERLWTARSDPSPTRLAVGYRSGPTGTSPARVVSTPTSWPTTA